jgi:hypothetical protein
MSNPQNKPSGRAGFGDADNKPKSYEVFSFESGKNESTIGPFRIFPPHGTMRGNKLGWAVFHAVHWGYMGVDRQDKTKKKNRVFGCIEKSEVKAGERMITVNCGECRNIEQKEADLQVVRDNIRQALKAQGIVEAKALEAACEAAEKVNDDAKAINEWLKKHNREGKYIVCVMTPDGKFGIVKLAGKHLKALNAKIDELKTKSEVGALKIDEGAWFTFTRKGTFNSTEHLVDYVTEPVLDAAGNPVKGATRAKLAPLTDEQCDQALEILPDLGTPPMASILSAEQIELLVEGTGDPEEVDTIFKMTEKSAPAAGKQEAPASSRTQAPPQQRVAQQPSVAPASSKAQSPATPPPAAQAPTEDPRFAGMKAMFPQMPDEQIRAMLASSPATTQAAVKVETKAETPAPAQTSAEDLAGLDPDQSPEDFANAFKLPAR